MHKVNLCILLKFVAFLTGLNIQRRLKPHRNFGNRFIRKMEEYGSLEKKIIALRSIEF